MARDVCSRCGKHPRRAANQRWCAACHAAYVRETRAEMKAEMARLQRKAQRFDRFRKRYGIDR